MSRILADGYTEGGQDMLCTLHREMIHSGENGFDRLVPVWRVDKVVVNEINITDEIEIPVYILDSYPEHPATFIADYTQSLDNSVMGFDYKNSRIIAGRGIRSFDNVATLIHEYRHSKTIKKFTTDEIDQQQKVINLVNQITSELLQYILDESAKAPNLDAKLIELDFEKQSEIFNRLSEGHREETDRKEMELLKKGAQLKFNDEIQVNNETLKTLIGDISATTWFKNDPDGVRLKKFLTVLNLSYSKTFNTILGAGTVDLSLAEIK